jgi:hypothetical protein
MPCSCSPKVSMRPDPNSRVYSSSNGAGASLLAGALSPDPDAVGAEDDSVEDGAGAGRRDRAAFTGGSGVSGFSAGSRRDPLSADAPEGLGSGWAGAGPTGAAGEAAAADGSSADPASRHRGVPTAHGTPAAMGSPAGSVGTAAASWAGSGQVPTSKSRLRLAAAPLAAVHGSSTPGRTRSGSASSAARAPAAGDADGAAAGAGRAAAGGAAATHPSGLPVPPRTNSRVSFHGADGSSVASGLAASAAPCAGAARSVAATGLDTADDEEDGLGSMVLLPEDGAGDEEAEAEARATAVTASVAGAASVTGTAGRALSEGSTSSASRSRGGQGSGIAAYFGGKRPNATTAEAARGDTGKRPRGPD